MSTRQQPLPPGWITIHRAASLLGLDNSQVGKLARRRALGPTGCFLIDGHWVRCIRRESLPAFRATRRRARVA